MSRPLDVEITTVATGVLFGEGPTWCDDGTVVCTAVAGGVLHRIWPAERRVEVFATTGGGPNACAPTADGGFLVTQNGGIDFSLHALPGFDSLPEYVPVTPGIQRVGADGGVEYLATRTRDGRPLRAPNDLVTTPDGVLYFTDPGHHPLPPDPDACLMRMEPDGTVSVVAEHFRYCNGVALDHLGRIILVEDQGLMIVDPDGSSSWLVKDLEGAPADGMAVDVTGSIYACCPTHDRIKVVVDGAITGFIEFPPQSFPTNCCFGGDDGRVLLVTLSLAHTVVQITGLPEPGVAVHEWGTP
jgi:gluconolactonase